MHMQQSDEKKNTLCFEYEFSFEGYKTKAKMVIFAKF